MSEPRSRSWEVRLERELFDSGIAGRLGTNPFLVYLALRAYLRSTPRRHRREAELIQEGALIASVRLAQLVTASGLAEGTVRRALGSLRDANAIRIEYSPGEVPIYVLGTQTEGFLVNNLFEPRSHGSDLDGVVDVDPDRSREEGTDRSREGGVIADGRGVRSLTGGESDQKNQGHPEQLEEQLKEQLEQEPRSVVLDPPRKPIRRATAVEGRPIRRAAIQPAPENPPADPPRKEWKAISLETTNRGGRPAIVADPDNPDRKLTDRELRILLSARAKVAEDRRRDFTGDEAVQGWRDGFVRAFGFEDPDLRTKASQDRLARMFERAAAEWEDGNREAILDYLRAMMRRWVSAQENPKVFVSGKVPRLSALLAGKNGEVPFFFREWRADRAERARGGTVGSR